MHGLQISEVWMGPSFLFYPVQLCIMNGTNWIIALLALWTMLPVLGQAHEYIWGARVLTMYFVKVELHVGSFSSSSGRWNCVCLSHFPPSSLVNGDCILFVCIRGVLPSINSKIPLLQHASYKNAIGTYLKTAGLNF